MGYRYNPITGTGHTYTYQVSGLCLTLRDNVAFSHQTIGRLSAYIPAIPAVIDDPAYKTGTIKTGAR